MCSSSSEFSSTNSYEKNLLNSSIRHTPGPLKHASLLKRGHPLLSLLADLVDAGEPLALCLMSFDVIFKRYDILSRISLILTVGDFVVFITDIGMIGARFQYH